MAYLALARKWRPKTFSEVVGQTHVVQALSNAIDSGRVHHAFLFTGTRGVGKTTLARIFAKSLNCEQGISAEPCQQCGTCQSIDEGRYVDLIEVDAASRTKVDDTRELLENVQYAPTSGKYKVYLIDEVHMLSGHSFNALLKTLEEPPEHVKFLFATTDPQKLPVTVLSRCLQFNLRAMRPEQVENQLVKIVNSEGVDFDQNAIGALAKAADGSMRDGLSLLDQAIALGAGTVRSADVESMLGLINAGHSEAILNALVTHDVVKLMQVIEDMADGAVDFSMAIDDLLMQLYHISLAQLAPAVLANSDVNQSLLTKTAEKIDPQTVQLYYQIGLVSKRDISLAPSLRIGFEMALLRMMAFEPDMETVSSAPQQGVKSQQSKKDKPKANSASPDPTAAGQNTQVLADDSQIAGPGSLKAQLAKKKPANLNQIQVHEIENQHNSEPPEPQNPAEPILQDNNHDSPSLIAITLAGNNEWGELIEQTQLLGLAKELAMYCACEKMTDDSIVLSLNPNSEHLFKPERLNEIQTQLRNLLNKPSLQVDLEVEKSDKETPAECLQRLGFEQMEQTKQNIKNDPGVKTLMSEFGATLNEQSIKPNDVH
ncbi:MAG: DNA polymerase III subunit gamma/tau [Acidiferrobacterales bacterium]|nr:DNA polymerase III subunit gamma/tau [Acidiferrobacterales bacterium]